ncbi:MAG: class I adenylate-forming enzyme family protein [Caldimonas sp.]
MISHPSPEQAAFFRSQGWWRDETLADWVAHWSESAGDRAALIDADGGTLLTYAQLQVRALALALSLQELGVERGDVVAAQLPNCAELVVAYLAAGLCGAVLQTVHMPYRGAEIEVLLRHSRAKVVLCVGETKDYRAAESMLALRARLAALREVIAIGNAVPAGCRRFDELVAGPGQAAGLRTQSASDWPYLLLYTSGTTSAPKGVLIAYDNFLSNARLSTAELGIDADSVLLSAAPFTHLYGLFSLNLTFAVGATAAVLPAFTPQALDQAIRRTSAQGLFLGPAHVAGCFAATLMEPAALRTVRFALVSGSAFEPKLAEALQGRLPQAAKVLQLWGMSELQAGTFTRPSDSLERRCDSVGTATPGTELRVVDVADQPLPCGVEGELQMRGCSLFSGYYENPEANAAAFTDDGWFRTGDLAQIDTGGYVRLIGRTKEIINRGGVKFNPVDVELLLLRHPRIAECAIVPMPDPVLGERACCFVTLKSDGSSAPAFGLDDIRAWLAQHEVTKLKWPERLEVLASMPTTPTRKIRKGELQAMARHLQATS